VAAVLSRSHGKKNPPRTRTDPQNPGELKKFAGVYNGRPSSITSLVTVRVSVTGTTLSLTISFSTGLSASIVGIRAPQKVQNLLSAGIDFPQDGQYIIL